MPYKPSQIENILQSKFGFSRCRTHSSDHHWYELTIQGLSKIVTKVSHSRADIGDRLASKIARQLHVRLPFFREMVDCTKNSDDYRRQMRESPYPPFDLSALH
jgi:hypothetical protein